MKQNFLLFSVAAGGTSAIVQFCGDIKQTVPGADHSTVRTQSVTEIHSDYHLMFGQIDHADQLAIGAGMPHTRDAVNGDKRASTIGRGD